MSIPKAKKTATKRAPNPGKKCTCIAAVDKMLKERGQRLALALSFDGRQEGVVIETEKTADAPKRVKRVVIVATFCPFCGVECP